MEFGGDSDTNELMVGRSLLKRRKRSYVLCFFFQAEDGIRDLVRSRGLGDVYKRQVKAGPDVHPGEKSIVPYQPPTVAVGAAPRRQLELSLIHI